MRKSIFLAAGVLLAVFMFTEYSVLAAGCVPAPEITRTLPRYDHGWVGSVCWHDGVIYEVTDSTQVAIMKDAETGASLGTMEFYGVPTDLQGICYDPWHDTWWIKPHQVHEAWEFNWNGNATGRKISTRSYALQIYIDPDEENVIWVGQSVYGNILKINLATNALLQTIPTNFGVRSVVKTGDYFWCTNAGEVGDDGILIKINASGQEVCRYYMPRAKYDHDTGGCSLDDEGQLWVEGGKDTNIYRIDIGYVPPTTIPTPTRTPLTTPSPVDYSLPILDSGDYNGDGFSDIAVFRPASGLWAVRGVTRFYFGRSGDIPASGDYSGNGTTAAAIFRPKRGLWAVRNLTRATFGGSADIPVPGDYNGDGTCDIGVFRGSSGLWAVRSITRVYFGSRADHPVPGYYAGSRSKDLAVFRPATGLWSIRGLTKTYYGQYGDIPVPEDYAGTGRDEIAVYRPGSRFWAVRGVTRAYFGQPGGDRPQPADYRGDDAAREAVYNSASGLWVIRETTRLYFGQRGDVPVAGPPPRPGFWRMPVIDSGDYTGNGISEIALFRDAAGLWAIRGRYQTFQVYFGRKGDLPVSGDYDGDGTTDIAVYRPSSSLWSARFVTRFYFGGEAGDLSAPGDYNGDGTCDSAIFNPRTTFWKVRIEIPFSSSSAAANYFGDGSELIAAGDKAASQEKASTATAPFIYQFAFGRKGDIPVPGYYGGRPRKKIAAYNPSSGLWSIRGMTQFYFGQPGDFPVAGDFSGNGTDQPGIFRPSSRLWAVRGLTRIYFGRHIDYLPAVADYHGNGTAEVGVFREKTGYWELRGLTRVYFGRAGDTPVVGARAGTASR